MSTATILYQFDSTKGHVAVVQVSPPLEGHEFIVSSAVDLDFGPLSSYFTEYDSCETYLFPAEAEAVAARSVQFGDLVHDYGELNGSIKGVKDHEAALTEAGYDTIAYAKPASAAS